MLRRFLWPLLLILLLSISNVVLTQDEGGDCIADTSTIEMLLDSVTVDLANGDLIAARLNLSKSQADLDAALAACANPVVEVAPSVDDAAVTLVDPVTYRNPALGLTTNFMLPENWRWRVDGIFVLFSSDESALEQLDVNLLVDTEVAGFLTIIATDTLTADGITSTDLETLVQDIAAFYGSLERDSLSEVVPLTGIANGAYVIGTYSAGGPVLEGAISVIAVDDAYLTFFVTSPQAELVPLLEAISNSVSVADSSDL